MEIKYGNKNKMYRFTEVIPGETFIYDRRYYMCMNTISRINAVSLAEGAQTAFEGSELIIPIKGYFQEID